MFVYNNYFKPYHSSFGNVFVEGILIFIYKRQEKQPFNYQSQLEQGNNVSLHSILFLNVQHLVLDAQRMFGNLESLIYLKYYKYW